MGSGLAPILANLFMGLNEEVWIENFQWTSEDISTIESHYRRYVDYIF